MLCFGVRQSFGDKRQICTVGGKKSNLPKDDLACICNRLIEELQAHRVDEADAKAWGKAEVEKAKTG